MKKRQLEQLIRHITKSVLKEYTSIISTDSSNNDKNDDDVDNDVNVDDMSSDEKHKLERQKELNKRLSIKQTQSELDAKKKEMEFNRKKLDTQKRFEIPNLTKDLQKLKNPEL